MVRFLYLFILLNLLGTSLEAQSGRYSIESVDSKRSDGYITVTPFSIRLEQDTFNISLPVREIVKETNRSYYILEGCYKGISFIGSATLIEGRRRKNKHSLTMYLEIRTARGYSFVRYSLFYYDN